MTEPMATDDRNRPDEWAATVQSLSARYPFPPAPPIAAQVRRRLEAKAAPPSRSARPAWQRPALALALLLLLLLVALSVPAVRAAVRDWLQIGAVRIVVTPMAEVATPAAGATALVHPLFGEPVTLESAAARARFELRLPTAAPADRPPDRVYVQTVPDLPGAQAIITVWEDAEGEPVLSLYQIEGGHYGTKVAWANALVETKVGGELAYWVEGPHPLLLGNGERWSTLSGDVLTWTDNVFTYRLESTLSLEETVTIAESLR